MKCFRFIDTQERILGPFSAMVSSLDGVPVNDEIKFPSGYLEGATPSQLSDLGIEAYTLPDPPVWVAPEVGTYEYAVQNSLDAVPFFFMLDVLGKRDEIQAAIDAIPDPTERAAAQARFHHSQSFHRDSELFTKIGPAVGLTPEQINEAWAQAVAFGESD